MHDILEEQPIIVGINHIQIEAPKGVKEQLGHFMGMCWGLKRLRSLKTCVCVAVYGSPAVLSKFISV